MQPRPARIAMLRSDPTASSCGRECGWEEWVALWLLWQP